MNSERRIFRFRFPFGVDGARTMLEYIQGNVKRIYLTIRVRKGEMLENKGSYESMKKSWTAPESDDVT